MSRKIISKIVTLFFCSILSLNGANAAINFRIDSKDIPKSKILISSVENLTKNDGSKNVAEEILFKVKRNLKGTDLFDIIQKESIKNTDIAADKLSIEKVPDLTKYNSAGVGMLLIADAGFNANGDLEMKIRLWDVLDERQIFGKVYSSSKGNYKKIANMISDEIYKATTGEKIGHFDSKIVYVAESGGALKRTKRLVMMDFDGENRRYLTNGKDLVLTPTFSKQKNEILFVRFFGEKPQIYSIDTNTNLVRKVGGFRNTTFAPAFNPRDKNEIVFCVIENGNSNIYQMNLLTNKLTRITSTRAIDTTPSYSPDGKYIVFSSDRTGSEQIYIMDSDGDDVKRISSEGGSYSKPVWSPDGKFIAFTKIKSGQFSIGLFDAQGKNEKTLITGYLVEGAKWSPSSRYLIYSRKDAGYGKASIPRLRVVDILTGFDREIPTVASEGATDPDWSLN
ncbi:MAG: tolB [Rickettsiaceae bacterium]|jgi:TolB protein|nr:tolB [Rickettsiaceae bacterium]